jgi:hypothetical protein
MRSIMTLAAGSLVVACASYPLPVQRLADAQAATRSAEDTGAANVPQANLHLRLAQESIAKAKSLIDGGDNKRADFLLIRAKADAELALGEAREQQAATQASNALDQISQLRGDNNAATYSVTTTTTTEKKP